AILIGAWLGWQLLCQNGRLLLRVEALEEFLSEFEPREPAALVSLPICSLAPEFELQDLAGETKSLAQFRGQPVLLISFNPACDFGRDLAPKLAALSSSSRRGDEADFGNPKSENGKPNPGDPLLPSAATNGLPLLIITTTGDAEKNRKFFREHKLDCPV